LRIIYLAPDSDKPSWGMGILYYHAYVLHKAGFDACIMHEKAGFTLSWLHLTLPLKYYSQQKDNLTADDILMVPEVMVGLQGLKEIPSRKILFVQNLFYLFESLPQKETHKSLGIKEALCIMPHMISVLTKYTGLDVFMVPPFIADYFYKENADLHKRKKHILLYPKYQNLDLAILSRLLQEHIRDLNSNNNLLTKILHSKDQWKIIELKNKQHKEVASCMKEAAFFVCLNAFEAFNTSVPEAMAAGCINFCYEAVGPMDFLANGQNAFVFRNNDIYALCSAIIEQINCYEENERQLHFIRTEAYKIAAFYSYDNFVDAMKKVFGERYQMKFE
jgi:hypothetical protein